VKKFSNKMRLKYSSLTAAKMPCSQTSCPLHCKILQHVRNKSDESPKESESIESTMPFSSSLQLLLSHFCTYYPTQVKAFSLKAHDPQSINIVY